LIKTTLGERIALAKCKTQAIQPPAQGGWPLRKILLGIVGAEASFYAVNHHAVEGACARDDCPLI
jgi:hypothetical protein